MIKKRIKKTSVQEQAYIVMWLLYGTKPKD